MSGSTRLLLLVAFSWLLGCGDSDSFSLEIVLRTDYRAGTEVADVEVEVELSDDGRFLRERNTRDSADDLLEGQVVATFDVAAGTYGLVVNLYRPDGTLLASRTTIVTVDADLSVTVLFTRDCDGVACPGPADATTATECVGGRCVQPGCGPDHPELCGEPDCVGDGDCAATVACTMGRCVDGVCFVEADDNACAAGERCDPSSGCVVDGSDASVSDGGSTDSGADAGSCPAPCDCNQSCSSTPCDCSLGCACELLCDVADCSPRCADDAECTVVSVDDNLDLRCEGRATCRVTAPMAQEVMVRCNDMSNCEVDCPAGSDCEVVCSPNATCLVRCGAAASCNLRRCSARMTCPGGAEVCNRTCP